MKRPIEGMGVRFMLLFGREYRARTLGRRQVARHGALVPASGGSSPPAPALKSAQRDQGLRQK